MATHRFIPTAWHSVLGTLPASLAIESGDIVISETIDANGWDKADEKAANGPNPMNGPIAVAGSVPGDTLRVDILAMTPIRATGWTRAALAGNVVDPSFVPHLPPRDRVTWRIDRNAQSASLENPPASLSGMSFPLAPMIGCFGVAPKLGQAISTSTSGEHGGNMDYRRFGPGATAWLPIAVPGALFFFGDCHALQGDGEIVAQASRRVVK